jgi:tetratricopeptide (TPR) repeat protein
MKEDRQVGRPIDRASWPTAGPHRDLLVRFDRVHRENGLRGLREIGKSMHLAYSRVSEILRGLACPSDASQVEALVKAMGGSVDDVGKALEYYGKVSASSAGRNARRSTAVPKVGKSADLTARVWPAASPIGYVTRDIEEEIAKHLASRRPVVLVGSSMVGKTRIAASVIEAEFAGRKLYTPDSQDELRALANSPPHNAVVFLDDIERLIGASGVTQRGIRALCEDNTLVATIRSSLYDDYQLPNSRRRAPEWDALGEFTQVVVKSDLSGNEKGRLAAVVRDEAVLQRILVSGIGEYVGAANVITRTLAAGSTHQPIAMALLAGATDWARAGLHRPVSAEVLTDLAAPYLTRRQAGVLRSAGLDDALAWATREINPRVSLLEPADDGFEINAYAFDVLSAAASPIPVSSWPVLLDAATPEDLIAIAGSAARAGQPDVSERALQRCEEANDPATWPLAAMLHGAGLRDRGDPAAAQAAYRRAIDSGHPVAAPGAWFNLGNLHAGEGRLDDARLAYENAAESGHPALAARAWLALGAILEREGRPADAEDAYRRAIAADPDLEAIRQYTERSLRDRGVNIVVETLDLRRYRPDPEVTARALLNLSHLLSARGERDSARQLVERAARLEGSGVTADAWHILGDLFAEEGKVRAAVDAYEHGLAVAEQDSAPKTECNLGAVLLHLREYDRAEAMLRSAVRSQHEEARVVASLYLVLLLVRRDRRDEAVEVLSEVAASADTAAGRSALGKVLLLQGAQGVSPALPQLARDVLHVLEGNLGAIPSGKREIPETTRATG